jgi:Flp pilus assembly protein protease CpaA
MGIGNIFLILLGFVWILFAVVQDLRKREIANWLNFSLIIFALAFRLFYSLFYSSDYTFFLQGLIGFGVFFILGNLLYYGKVFAGGDAKLMIALGAVLPFSQNWITNTNLALMFLVLFLIAGALYGIVFSLYLGIKNRKRFVKEFSREFKEKRRMFYIALIVAIILLAISSFERNILYLSVLIFISPYVYISAKAIDESCMIKKVNTKELTEGDWLYNNLRIGKTLIKANWEGLSQEEISLLMKKKKEVFIRQGIPFSPVFLISYIVLICVFLSQNINSFWLF